MTVVGASAKIRILPEAVANRIAAGEVIERPAAVVRELVDNSLDAGARRIEIDVADGGRCIRVRDDGEGMSRADARLAFERHATSKLHDDGELRTIRTLGFRGEALPSVAAVARVRLTTASREEPVGTTLTLVGGRFDRMDDAVRPPGTELEVSDLFFNTPARLKFLKSPATECSHISLVVQQAAVAHPAVQFRYAQNGQTLFDYPAVTSLHDRLLQVYGAGLAQQMVPVHESRSGLALSGFTIDAVRVRASRTPQELFVNHRAVRNAAIMHAVYDGYGPALAKGRHPLFVLLLEVEPGGVDVNVHPAKREVRFAQQDSIHQFVRAVIRRAVGQPATEVEPGASTTRGESRVIPVAASLVGTPARAPEPLYAMAPPAVAESRASYVAASAGQTATQAERPLIQPLGQVHETFVVAQVGTELQIIDQHTAHERVLFERLCRDWKTGTVAQQPLLVPETIEVPPHQGLLIAQHLSDLAALGLAIEPFGSQTFIVRAVPALLGTLSAGEFLQDLVEDLSAWNGAATLDARVKPIFATMACHAAVRAGRSLQAPEMARLIEDWWTEGMPTTCPHGRRVALRLPADELLKMFGRS